MKDFYNLKFSSIIAFILQGNTSFQLILLYLVIEYLRPQSMYPVLQVIPWGGVVLVGMLIFGITEQKLMTVKNSSSSLINIFFLVIVASSISAISPKASLSGIKTIFIFLLVYYFIINFVDNEKKLFIFTLLILLISLKLSQAVFINWISRGFQYDQYGAAVGSGWLENSGELAIQLCIAFSLSICYLKSLWPHNRTIIRFFLLMTPIIFAGGIVACGSRGSYLALATVIVSIVLFSKKKLIGIILLFTILLSLPLIISDRDINRMRDMGGEQDQTAANRMERWKKGFKMVKLHPVLGVGYENWAVADAQLFDGTGAECHNIFIECISELGSVGLTVFILLIISTYKNNSETIKLSRQTDSAFLYNLAFSLNLSLLAYLVAGFFVTVLYYPYFWINLAMSVSLNNIAKEQITSQSQ